MSLHCKHAFSSDCSRHTCTKIMCEEVSKSDLIYEITAHRMNPSSFLRVELEVSIPWCNKSCTTFSESECMLVEMNLALLDIIRDSGCSVCDHHNTTSVCCDKVCPQFQ